jgi:hypothetical protein
MTTTLSLEKAKITIKELLKSIARRCDKGIQTVLDKNDQNIVRSTLQTCELDLDSAIDRFEDSYEFDGLITTEKDDFSYKLVNERMIEFIDSYPQNTVLYREDSLYESIDKAKNVIELRKALDDFKDELKLELASYVENFEIDINEADVEDEDAYDTLLEIQDNLESISHRCRGTLGRRVESLLSSVYENVIILEKKINFENDHPSIIEIINDDIDFMYEILNDILSHTDDPIISHDTIDNANVVVSMDSISKDEWDLIKLFLENKDKITSLLEMVEKI